MLYWSAPSWAAQVALFSVPQMDDRPTLELEPNGRFFHVALSYRGGWLHAHPTRGVEFVSSVSELGSHVEIWENPNVPDPKKRWVQRELRKPYDPLFRWEDRSTTYCSKLVGRFLKIPPTVMTFLGQFWRASARPEWARLPHPVGALGLSPDEIAHWLRGPGSAAGWLRKRSTGYCWTYLR